MKKIKILDFAILILVLIAKTIIIIIGLRIKQNKDGKFKNSKKGRYLFD